MQQSQTANDAVTHTEEGTLLGPTSNCNDAPRAFPPKVLQKTLDSLKEIFNSYTEMLTSDPNACHAGFEAFIKQNQMLLHSQSGLLSAMHCFGKSLGPSAYSSKKRNVANIPIQPTSKARRTTYMGGSKAQFTGRPPKALGSAGMSSDHSYGTSATKRKFDEPVWSSLPKRSNIPAPHRLEICVESSRMIGGNHSKK